MFDPETIPADAPELQRIRERLQGLYRELDEEIARAGPRCELSGRCCRFKEYGHTLFLSSPEAALLLADAPPPVRPLDDEGATCPWQDELGRCHARSARPLGCRIYYCDPAYQSLAPVLIERYLDRLKRLVVEEAWPWSYAPLHRHLRAAADAGAFPEGVAANPEP